MVYQTHTDKTTAQKVKRIVELKAIENKAREERYELEKDLGIY